MRVVLPCSSCIESFRSYATILVTASKEAPGARVLWTPFDSKGTLCRVLSLEGLDLDELVDG